ncbi:MAG: hypothetical protein ACRELB_17635, partial [Polyangiaceae bacterium]
MSPCEPARRLSGRPGPARLSGPLAALALLLPACGAPAASARAPEAAAAAMVAEQRARTGELAQAEDDVVGWLAAADPRLAARTGATGPDEVLQRIGMDAVLAEDTAAVIRGKSLDLFAFRARAMALDQA